MTKEKLMEWGLTEEQANKVMEGLNGSFVMVPIVQNRIISFSMITIKLEIPVLPIIIPPCPRRFGGGSVPLVTMAALLSAMSLRTEVTTAVALTTLLVCGPALPSNPPQDDPALIPPPEGGGSGREPQRKIRMAA